MILYKKKALSVLKYLIAFIVFILAMTITFDDVYGFHFTNSIDQTETTSDSHKDMFDGTSDDDIVIVTDDNDNNNDQNPTVTPEPGTLILLASGLGVISLYKKRKS